MTGGAERERGQTGLWRPPLLQGPLKKRNDNVVAEDLTLNSHGPGGDSSPGTCQQCGLAEDTFVTQSPAFLVCKVEPLSPSSQGSGRS